MSTRSDYEDDEVRRAYHALSDDEVPPALDQRIIEAARSAIESQRQKARWRRWLPPLALAASLVVAIVIVLDPDARKKAEVASVPRAAPTAVHEIQMTSRSPARANPDEPTESFSDHGEREQSVTDPKEGKPQEGVRTQRAATANRARSAPRPQETSVAVSPVIQATTAAPTPPPPAAPSERDANADDEQTSMAERRLEAASQGDRRHVTPQATVSGSLARIPRAAKEQDAATASDVHEAPAGEEVRVSPALDPQMTAWLEKIHALQSEGKHGRAKREIEKFKRAYPHVDVEGALEALKRGDSENGSSGKSVGRFV
jgi:hypothetical protein